MTANNAISYYDFLGFRKDSAGFDVTGKGHQIIPVELWEMFGFPEEAKYVFDTDEAATKPVRAYKDPKTGVFWKHGSTAHGIDTGYSAHVRDEIADFLRKKGLSGKKLKVDEYVKLAEELVDHISKGRSPFIKDYLKHVYDPQILHKWHLKNRHRYILAGGDLFRRGLAAIPFKGILRIRPPKSVKCLRKVPILKFGALIFAGYVYDMEYNNARADGYSAAKATGIAGARVADPGLEMA
jgi:hypothetical protein